jgi:hypothetical protein
MRKVSVLGFVIAALASAARAQAAEPVDLQLVIAADTSSSIDDEKAALERAGVIAAFRSPDIVRAIQSGALGKIAVLYMDWSGGYNNEIVAGWHRISDKASAAAFADELAKAPRTYGQGTDIGAALQMGATLITASNVASTGFQGTRRAIDISGDGPANRGRIVADVRDEVVAKGIIINGLPVMTGEYGGGDWGAYYGKLDQYYMHCIIGGTGSFILPAKGFQEFVTAMRRKLVLEISDAAPRPRFIPAAAIAVNPLRPPPKPAQDCGGRGFRDFGNFR